MKIEMSRVVRRWPAIAVLVYTIVLAATAGVGTPGAPVPAAPRANLLDKPLGEDAFYMFSVARGFAEGQGVSYGHAATTGVQPLATLAYAGLYRVAAALHLGDEMPLRMILVFNGVLLILTALICGRLVRRWVARRGATPAEAAACGEFAVLCLAVNPGAYRLFLYGLETGLYLLLLALVWLYLDRKEASGRSLSLAEAAVLGGLAGSATLARIDFLVLGAAILTWFLMTRRLSVAHALVATIVAGLIALPWLMYIHDVSGSWMPTSGSAQAARPENLADLGRRARAMVGALVPAAGVIPFLPSQSAPILLGLAAVVAGIVWRLRNELAMLAGEVRPWLGAATILGVYYFVESSAGHFYGRYLAPWWLAWSLWVTAAAALRWRAMLSSRPAVHQAAALGLLAVFAVQVGYTVHRGHASNSHLYTVMYLSEPRPDLGLVGSFQSGLVGYVTRERVVNLDGKVNARALAWRLAGRLDCYLTERGIQTVIDWPGYLENGWIPREFLSGQMRKIGAISGGDSIVMSVLGPSLACPELAGASAATTAR